MATSGRTTSLVARLARDQHPCLLECLPNRRDPERERTAATPETCTGGRVIDAVDQAERLRRAVGEVDAAAGKDVGTRDEGRREGSGGA